MKKKAISPNSHPYQGFEKSPQGSLLDQTIDLNGDMGVAYERSHGFYKDFHSHDRLIVVAPRGTCTMSIELRRPTKIYNINSSHVLLVPKGLIHNDDGVSQIYDTFALLPEENFIITVLQREKKSQEKIQDFITSTSFLKKTEWLDRLLQEYFYERIVSRKMSLPVLKPFEELLIMELYKIWSGFNSKNSEPVDADLPLQSEKIELDPVIQRALRYIEGNLFNIANISELATGIGASPATLRRHFSKALKKGPQDYIRERRLEEAAKLLGQVDLSVSEVASLVGYENFGAFSEAFKKQFGKPPSEYRKNKSL